MVEIKNPLYDAAKAPTQALHADGHLRVTSDVSAPITVSTTYEYSKANVTANNYGPDQRYVYSREGTPTTTKVESVLSTLTEGHAVLYGSGLTAALAVLLEHKPKKIAVGATYFGIKAVIKRFAAMACPAVTVVGAECDADDIDMFWIESPLNPTGEALDIGKYALRARACGAKLVVDATFAPPPLSYPFRQGADIVVHSATKYLGGHSDLLAGVVVEKCSCTAERMRETRYVFGLNAGSLDAWLLLRSLRTLSVRVLQQSSTTTRIVAMLEEIRRNALHTKCHTPCAQELALGRNIAEIKHASLQCCEFVAKQHPNGFGGVFSVKFATQDQALFVAKHLRLHRFATSIGAVESLVDWRHGWDSCEDPTLIRVSVGLEAFEDLAADWKSTLAALDQHVKETCAKL